MSRAPRPSTSKHVSTVRYVNRRIGLRLSHLWRDRVRGGNAEYHPALSARVTAQDNFPRATVADRAHRTARAISPAERLLGIPVNYYGAVEDSTSQRRPRLRELTAPHTLFMGATGSGKTLGMKLHMKSILPPSNPDYAMNFRSLV